MADTNTRVIIDVSINQADADKKANDLAASIKKIKQEQKELKAANEETSVAYRSNSEQLRILQREQTAYIKLANEAEGSNNQLRAQLALLTIQYDALSSEERDSTNAGKALAIQIKTISDTLKSNEGRVGDNRRSVGGYKDAIVEANKELGNQGQALNSLNTVLPKTSIGFQLAGDQIGKVSNQITNFREALGEAREAQSKFTELQEIATGAQETAAQATEAYTAIGFQFARGEASIVAVEAARVEAEAAVTVSTAAATAATEAQTTATLAGANAAKVLKIALLSTGIGAIIVLVAALGSYLSKFDPIVDKVEQAFAGLGAVFNTIGRLITGLFTNATSLMDLFSKIGNALAHPIDTFKELGNEIAEAAVQAANLKKAQQDLEDQQKIQEVTNAKAIQQIQQLTLQARNRALSEKERQDLLKQAAKLDTDNFNDRTKIANKEIEIAQKQIAITAGLNKEEIKQLKEKGLEYAFQLKDRAAVTDEEIDALKAAELSRVSILTESTNRQEKLQNQSDALQEKAEKAAEAAEAARAKRAEKVAEADQERIESLLRINELILTEQQRSVAALNNEIDEKVKKYKQYGATVTALEQEREARLRQIAIDGYEKEKAQVEANQREIEDLIVARIKDAGERSLAQLKLNQQRELAENEKQINDVYDRKVKGETNLEATLQSLYAKRAELQKTSNAEINQLLQDQYSTDLEAFNKHQIDLANAKVDAAGTDAEKLIAQQELLEAQYQADIDYANRTGQDTTAIVAQYENEKRQVQEATVNAAFEGFKKFSEGFQSLVGENTVAYKAAAFIQAKLDAAQALRNNVLIIQENIKALTSQGKLPFPTNIIAIFSTLAALGSALSSAKTILAPPKFAEGGIFRSDGRGAVLPGYSKTDNTNAQLRSGEVVIVSEAARDPRTLAALSAINEAHGGRRLAPAYAMATGGIAQGGFVSSISDRAFNASDLANMIIAGVSAAPAPVVSVVDITSGIQRQNNNVANLTI